MSSQRTNLNTLVLMGVLMAMTVVMTMIIRIPVPATQGYIHLGDSMVILSVFILGKGKGALTGGLGAALADILGGYATFAPITFCAKALLALVLGLFMDIVSRPATKKGTGKALAVLGAVLGGIVMIAVYYVAEGFMYGSFITPVAEIPMNAIQVGVGAVLAGLLAHALCKTSVGRNFSYNIVAR